jgi:hypothetical protein
MEYFILGQDERNTAAIRLPGIAKLVKDNGLPSEKWNEGGGPGGRKENASGIVLVNEPAELRLCGGGKRVYQTTCVCGAAGLASRTMGRSSKYFRLPPHAFRLYGAVTRHGG